MAEGIRGDIKRLLSERGTLQGRPSARQAIQIVLTRPGVQAVAMYRFYRWLYRRRLRLLAQLFCRLNLFLTGAEIDPGAEIGGGFRLSHSSGVVIGRGVKIGNNVSLLHNVTLGGSGKGIVSPGAVDGYPAIGDNVWIFTGAMVLGPITIGSNSMIGANCVVTESVPEGTVVGAARFQTLADELRRLRQEVEELRRLVTGQADMAAEPRAEQKPPDEVERPGRA